MAVAFRFHVILTSTRHVPGRRGSFLPDLNLDWLKTLFFIVLGPAMVLSLHTLAKRDVYRAQWPDLSRDWKTYWHRDSFVAVFAFVALLRLLGFLPLGSAVRAVNGQEVSTVFQPILPKNTHHPFCPRRCA